MPLLRENSYLSAETSFEHRKKVIGQLKNKSNKKKKNLNPILIIITAVLVTLLIILGILNVTRNVQSNNKTTSSVSEPNENINTNDNQSNKEPDIVINQKDKLNPITGINDEKPLKNTFYLAKENEKQYSIF